MMTTLEQQVQERMDQRPDKHTLAWWDSRFDQIVDGYRGLTHATNLVLAQDEDRGVTIADLKKQVESLTQELHETKAAVGKLQADFTESMSKVRDAYAELKKKADSK